MPNPSKIHPRLRDSMQAHALASTSQGMRVIVKFRAPLAQPVTNLRGVLTMRRHLTILPASILNATADGVSTLSDLDEVEMIWPDGIVHTLLDQSVPLIGVPQVWRLGWTGQGIKVAIVDTGIDSSHPDFAGRIVKMVDFTGTGPEDDSGHGTHVAGIVGGTGAASQGRFKGVAPECLLYSAKVLRANGSGNVSDVMAGIEWAVQQEVQVINLSLGDGQPTDGTDPLSAMCDAAVSRGVCVSVAAGNSGWNNGTIGSPGCARSVITVGATTKTDLVAAFSSRGPTSDGRVKPDLCFPGVDIVSCRAKNGQFGVAPDNYVPLSGTSMAAAHAAGACALVLQANPVFSPSQVKDALMNGAANLGLEANTQGRGRAQVSMAFQTVTLTSASLSPLSLASGQVLNVSITVKNNSATIMQTQGPEPGFIYEEGDSFLTRGFAPTPDAFRVGIDFDGNPGIDHPYRWGLGAPLAPGESTTVNGEIRLKSIQTRNFWAGLVQEQIAWRADRVGTQKVSVSAGITIEKIEFTPISLDAGQLLDIHFTVRNAGTVTFPTQGPEPGFVYEEGDTFASRGYPAVGGNFRVAVDCDSRPSLDHPYRWGLGTPLAPGQTANITGRIHLNSPRSQKYWGGLVQEYIAWVQDRVGTTNIAVLSASAQITKVTFSPTTLETGQFLVVGFTIQNNSSSPLATQGPEPGFAYAEGDTFDTRGFPAQSGCYRVGINWDNPTGIDHPYRWGLGSPLGPGETRTITGLVQLQKIQSQPYWAGMVREHVAWLQDHVGTQLITTQLGATITAVDFSPTDPSPNSLLTVRITVRNDSPVSLPTQSPDPGFVYEEGDTFDTRGFPATSGSFRVGIDLENRPGIDHPYRWGFGTPLGPGETRTIIGQIRLKTPQAQKYWAGIVREFVAWLQDRQGTQIIAVH